MKSLDKDLRIVELETEVEGLKKKVELYKERVDLLDNGQCPHCIELEQRIKQLEYQNTELRFALKNPRNAGRKRIITDEIISKVIQDKLAGLNVKALAEKYHLSTSTIYRIINATESYLIDVEE